jgi:hypothetical protein
MSVRHWSFKHLVGLVVNAGGLVVLIHEALSLALP